MTVESAREKLLESFPVGTVVEMVASEHRGWRGVVTDVVIQGSVPYLAISLTNGVRGNLLPTPRLAIKRASSVIAVALPDQNPASEEDVAPASDTVTGETVEAI